MNPVYISAAAALSPQYTFEAEGLLQDVRSSDNGKLFVTDADYSKFINPVAIRRMSRLLKMGISTGMKCMQLAGIRSPDGIITGTGRGSMRDMEIFLGDMIRLKEETLNPTYFIQSTYNSVNGWLAMQTKCNGYNQTYVHRGHSLEMALLDAQMLLNETNERKTYLVGAFDEMTDEYFLVKSKKAYWKKPVPNSLDLFKHSDTKGSIGGEGAAFFTVTNDKENTICGIEDIRMLQDPDENEINRTIENVLQRHHLNIKNIDLVLCGMNGDSRFQPLYANILTGFTARTSITAFKHLTGEYDTSTSFALWLATELFKRQEIPEIITLKKGIHSDIKNVLIVNHYILNSASILLLKGN
ncbi:MAG: hypothetical protein BGO70_04945 [Bacteroidetes bacterium 43-93]|nr:MAG: hypothetical protein BGO70_04945 [Bacteroidetes bacterium 43-93]